MPTGFTVAVTLAVPPLQIVEEETFTTGGVLIVTKKLSSSEQVPLLS